MGGDFGPTKLILTENECPGRGFCVLASSCIKSRGWRNFLVVIAVSCDNYDIRYCGKLISALAFYIDKNTGNKYRNAEKEGLYCYDAVIAIRSQLISIYVTTLFSSNFVFPLPLSQVDPYVDRTLILIFLKSALDREKRVQNRGTLQ